MICVVGLTGGIGCGKSAAAAYFATLGAAVIDTDVIAHELTAANGKATEPIRAAFGTGILTPAGALDRTAMRERVFADAAARKRLEAILHPLIRAECDIRISRAASADFFSYALLVVPLLVESGDYRKRVSRVCVIDCPQESQITRTMTRSDLSRAEVLAIMSAQASREERLAAADDIIDNSADIARLHAQIDLLHERYRKLATIY